MKTETVEDKASALSDIRERMEQEAFATQQAVSVISATSQTLEELATSYLAVWQELFMLELQNRKMSWCNACFTLADEDYFKLYVREGVKVVPDRSDELDDRGVGCKAYSALYRLCRDCAFKGQEQHGYQGRYDKQTKLRECHYIFEVEKRDDGYYCRMFGQWQKFTGPDAPHLEKYPEKWLRAPSNQKYIHGWGLPPFIEVKSEDRILFPKLVIAGQVFTKVGMMA